MLCKHDLWEIYSIFNHNQFLYRYLVTLSCNILMNFYPNLLDSQNCLVCIGWIYLMWFMCYIKLSIVGYWFVTVLMYWYVWYYKVTTCWDLNNYVYCTWLYQLYVGDCSLSIIYFMYMIFQELVSSGGLSLYWHFYCILLDLWWPGDVVVSILASYSKPPGLIPTVTTSPKNKK
jgi:hypothetical protein